MKTTLYFFDKTDVEKARELFWEVGSRENITIPDITFVQFIQDENETRVTFAYTNAEAAVAVYEATNIVLEWNDWSRKDVLFQLWFACHSHDVECQYNQFDN